MRESIELTAQAAEKDLAEAVEAEESAAGDFHTAQGLWIDQMTKVYAPCKLQADNMDVTEELNPQTTFTCSFDKAVGDVENCDDNFNTYSTNVSEETQSLNTSLKTKQAVYDGHETDCKSNISEANDKFDTTKDKYNAWKYARDEVYSKYDARKSVVCGSSSTSFACTSTSLSGLDYIAYEECEWGTESNATKVLIETRNISQSLGDRNYEIQSLNIVVCLLEKLSSFNEGNYSEEGVSDIVEGCSATDAPKKYDEYVMYYKTSASQDFNVTGASDCEPAAAVNVALEQLNDDSSCAVDKTGSVQVGYTETGESVRKYTKYVESMAAVSGIPAKYGGTVVTFEVWDDTQSANGNEECVFYFCPAGEADCFTHTNVPRTDMQCASTQTKTLKDGNLVELNTQKARVPLKTDYVVGDGVQEKLSSGRLVGCA